MYYEYIPYRNLVRANITDELNSGNNSLYTYCKDNAGNDLSIKTIFYIK